METNPEDNAMRRTHQSVAIVGGAFSIAGLVFYGAFIGSSVIAGVAIASINLLILSRTVRSIVEGGGVTWAGVALIKFLVLLAATYVLIQNGLVNSLALAVGFGALPIGILLAGTFGAPRDDSASGGHSLSHGPGRAPLPSTQSIESDHA